MFERFEFAVEERRRFYCLVNKRNESEADIGALN